MNFPIFCSFWALLLQADVASVLTTYATDRGLKKQQTHALTGVGSLFPLCSMPFPWVLFYVQVFGYQVVILEHSTVM